MQGEGEGDEEVIVMEDSPQPPNEMKEIELDIAGVQECAVVRASGGQHRIRCPACMTLPA